MLSSGSIGVRSFLDVVLNLRRGPEDEGNSYTAAPVLWEALNASQLVFAIGDFFLEKLCFSAEIMREC